MLELPCFDLRDITAQKRAEEELRGASRRIIEAQEAERLRVARELHDCISQTIATARMSLSKVADLLGESPAAATILGRCDRLLAQALEDNRRIAHNLRPRELDEFGLTVACRELCKALRRRARLQVKYQIAEIGRPLAPLTELNLFRIAQEAMANVENHARAKTVWLGIYLKNDSLVLRVRDDGRGFAPGTGRKRKTKGHGLGLANIRERAAALGASCEVASVPKKGTTITVRVPIKKAV